MFFSISKNFSFRLIFNQRRFTSKISGRLEEIVNFREYLIRLQLKQNMKEIENKFLVLEKRIKYLENRLSQYENNSDNDSLNQE